MISEKQYLRLPVYRGERNFCESCKRPFRSGEIIAVDLKGDILFCYSSGSGQCITAYYMMPQLRKMRFRSGYLPAEDRMPNNTVLLEVLKKEEEEAAERKNWFMALLDFLGL
ncbi:MAG: hypothetical protein HZB99_02200 [Candidatus Harrisonbacteria bacterium]|nr:hypothetical protein [Candidatus Harrisonbacteria bacterium]